MATTRLENQFFSFALFNETDIENVALTIKPTSVVVHSMLVDNSANAAITYLKLWNTNDAVVVGTTGPDEVYLIPASTKLPISFPGGRTFATGLAMACVTTAIISGSTSPTSSVLIKVVYV